ncbi:hypothetical protein POM88_028270 [Heracleum sosnowskyi]|uniref:Uncharacterized protein n=1 Tax=Heracleum sosnowskyi TaxID=360622 RepID=A0AAD8MQA7_9APIA|nr:hypothetical protein POM88_028270 [Heracleum sosnowskyi]
MSAIVSAVRHQYRQRVSEGDASVTPSDDVSMTSVVLDNCDVSVMSSADVSMVTGRSLKFVLARLNSSELRLRRMASSNLICETQPWKDLKAHLDEIKNKHLRNLMSDTERCKSMMLEFDNLFLDYSRQCATTDTIDKLLKLAEDLYIHVGWPLYRKYGHAFEALKLIVTDRDSM